MYGFTFRFLLPLLLIQGLHAAGLTVYPMEQFVKPGRPAIYAVSNTQTKAMAVEVFVESWRISEEGKEIREPSQDLIVFPSQFILKGNTSRRIKVGTRSKQKVEHEKAYRVTIRELPISFEVEEGALNNVYMANAYRTSFYVEPHKKEANLELVDSGVKGAKLHVKLRNTGNVHTHLLEPALEIETTDGKRYTYENDDLLDPVAGQNMHASITRNFVVDLKKLDIPGAVRSIQLKIKNARSAQDANFSLIEEEVIITPSEPAQGKELSYELLRRFHTKLASLIPREEKSDPKESANYVLRAME